jgi:hypothetical protein
MDRDKGGWDYEHQQNQSNSRKDEHHCRNDGQKKFGPIHPGEGGEYTMLQNRPTLL